MVHYMAVPTLHLFSPQVIEKLRKTAADWRFWVNVLSVKCH